MTKVFESIFSSVEAFIYRCRNDSDYTMETMQGSVAAITGYAVEDMIGNKIASWVGITSPKDKERVFAEVDAAIEAGETWDTAYRIVSKSGAEVWVRERGNAVYEGGELAYLQGLIVSAAAERALAAQLEDVAARTKEVNSQVINLSNDIAKSVQKLSILSVNARIEAARSGPAGAGFKVVADEMRSLADENGRLARVIGEKIAQG